MSKSQKNDLNLNHIVCIPRHGLGDILYNCLALKALVDEGLINNVFVFVPAKAKGLVEIFGLTPVYTYPSFLQFEKDEAGVLNFFFELNKYRHSYSFSLVNDFFDHLLNKCFELTPWPKWTIGNYTLLHRSGFRYKFNNLLKFKTNIDNPMHILERSRKILKPLFDYDIYVAQKYFNANSSLKKVDGMKAYSTIILPDAGDDRRFLSIDNIKKIACKINSENLLVVSERPEVIRLCNESKIDYMKYPEIKTFFSIVSSCSTVYTSDSFGAHVAGLLGKNMYIFYPNYLYKHWESWGIPSLLARHIYKDKIYFLDPKTYKSIDTGDTF